VVPSKPTRPVCTTTWGERTKKAAVSTSDVSALRFLLTLRIGITARVPKGSFRESRAALNRSNLGLRESLLRLKYLDYDNGTDSETYSADSYNSSDESADSASETDAHDEERDESGALFCTPSPRPINLFTGSVYAAQDSSVSTGAQSMAGQESMPVCAKRPGALRRVTKSRSKPRHEATTGPSTTATPHNAGSATRFDNPPSVRKSAANARGPFSHYDRSSSTIPTPRSEESHLPIASDDSQDFGGCGDDFGDDMGLMTENFNFAKDGQPPKAELSKSERLAAKSNFSPAAETSTTTSQPVLPSIETGERRSTLAQIDNSPSADGLRSSVSIVSKKRASSQPPMHERPSRRSTTSSSFDSMYSLTPGVAERSLPEQPHLIHHSVGVKEEKVKREFTHPGCVAHRPCINPTNFTVRSGRPLVAVYKNEIGDSRRMTLGQAEFIISHCTCHWANGFTEVWADAQGKFGNLTKAEVLLAYFQDNLWRAARACCPPRPGHVECIVIDD
jgi:hypothetical protein